MTDSEIPILKFKREKAEDIPYEIMRIRSGSHYPSVPFRQTFYAIAILTAGAGKTYIDFKEYSIEQGAVYFITPGQIQRWESTQPTQGYIILFEESFLPMNQADPITPRSFDFFHRTDLAPALYLDDTDTQFFDLCEAMLHGYAETGFGRTALLQSYLRVFLIQAQRVFVQQHTSEHVSSGASLVTNYIQLIDMHFLQKQRVADYAMILGITPGYLTDTTREQLGFPAGKLIQRRILLEAKRLLTYTEQSIGEIAFHLNFIDPSYFARYFRRETGESPTAFRANIRKKYPLPRSQS